MGQASSALGGKLRLRAGSGCRNLRLVRIGIIAGGLCCGNRKSGDDARAYAIAFHPKGTTVRAFLGAISKAIFISPVRSFSLLFLVTQRNRS
jgi:hypothetical protein